MKTVEEAKAMISKVSASRPATFVGFKNWFVHFVPVACLFLQKQVQANVCVTLEMVKEALDMLRGAVMIVYPMGLPPHDPIRMEFEGREDLAGTQVKQLSVEWRDCGALHTGNSDANMQMICQQAFLLTHQFTQ